jgi:hypothetical protein
MHVRHQLAEQLERQGIEQCSQRMPSAVARWLARKPSRGAWSIDVAAGLALVMLYIVLEVSI